ncbi:Trp repressor-binding protein [Mariprofundus sp. EBB-1]|uniref:flavodoxin domain-containing protein n=1 Tax=Mariprofundus sp. EBB-1 TaxID=2650971 RepID=UPI000EF1E088|nr:NAD(P)H-dependent oxidoreductase [Mariprofundus sp. EBB-1]RLL51186.1 Trp repressor-binding protein [Mariprofundus sp. EBB-1]
MNVLIAYHSDYGNTQKMASAIAAGINVSQSGAQIVLKSAAETGLDDLIHADIILFGTSVHMGSMAWPMKKLIDQAGKLWMDGSLEGKVGGVFATGGGFGGAGGGVEQTMISLYSNFLEHGMIVIGFPKSLPGYADGGLQWGPYGRTGNHEGMPSGISDTALAAARSYGAHLSETAARIIAD